MPPKSQNGILINGNELRKSTLNPEEPDYLHLNPVRHGLVASARDWKWSSAAWFEGGSSPLLLDPIPWEWLAG